MNAASVTVAAAAHEVRTPGNPLELVLEHLRRVVRADAAALVSVDVDRRTIEPTATWFASPAVERAVAPALRRPYDHERPGLVEVVLERGRPLSLPRLEDWEAAEHARAALEGGGGPDAIGSWEVVRHASVIACPVRTALGRTLGALLVASMNPDRPLRRRDLDIVVVLADLAALAHERSELMAVEAARGREELLLKRAAESTSSSLEPDEVVERVVEHGLLISSSDHGRVTRLSAGSERLRVAAESGPRRVVEESAHGSPRPEVEQAEVAYVAAIAEVARSRAAQVLAGEDPSVHVPLALGRRLFGVLSLTRRGGPAFEVEDVALVTKLAQSSAGAIANALDFQHERKVAGALTQGFVPEALAEVPGWEVGLLYEPAENQPTGGDVYGAWTLPSGEVALLVGDVAGKGLETAATSAMARFFIEARTLGCDNPAQVLAQANALLCSRLPSETFVTAFLGFLGRDGVRYANAGHLAPLVVRGDGEISEAVGGELPLGIEEQPSFEQRELELERGDTLFAFTDGIVEARRDGELLGERRLREILKRAAESADGPQELARLVHGEVREWASSLSDDAAIVALRRRGLSVVSGP